MGGKIPRLALVPILGGTPCTTEDVITSDPRRKTGYGTSRAYRPTGNWHGLVTQNATSPFVGMTVKSAKLLQRLPDLYSFCCLACDAWHVEEGDAVADRSNRRATRRGASGLSDRTGMRHGAWLEVDHVSNH